MPILYVARMKYAVVAPVAANVTADPVWMTAFAQHVEACGFESLVVVEHTVVTHGYTSRYPYDTSGRMELDESCEIPDPLELLAFLAGRTTRLGLATGVLVLPNHHPVVLAKRLATLDVLSGGRLRLCVGMGWMREEVEACGADFDSRGRRADEQLDVMRKLWSPGEKGADHQGEFFRLDRAMSFPKPLGAIPVHIGGHSRAAARRAGRLGDGLQPLGVHGGQLTELVDLMHREAEAAGRDPAALELSLGHLVRRIDRARAETLAAKGADRLVLAMTPTSDLERAKDELSACAQRLELR